MSSQELSANPSLRGAVAEAEIVAAAVRLGIPAFTPAAEHGRADLVLEIDGRLLRVQCKWGSFDPAAGVIKVNLVSSRCTPAGYVRTMYAEDEIDAVAVYCEATDECYLLPSELVVGRGSIWLRVKLALNGQRGCVNLASNFELSGAIAQSGERLRGTQEVAGSSPASSTPTVSGAPHVVGANRFRKHFGYYLDCAAAGADVIVTRHGKPFVRSASAASQAPLAPSLAA